MKKIIYLFAVVSFLISAELKITSKFFNYDSKKLESIFKGDVNATKGSDNILCNELIVYFNKNKKPIKYIAIGNVRFIFKMDENSTYKGKTDKLTYLLMTGEIILNGNAFIKKIETNESISGDIIKINRITKNIEVEGNKKPVNIIIKVDE
ncbi:lipopolysaccharide transport periplasmic protein LptA [Caminibacter mediatlanticus]|uniref:OstA family protein n=1 Tax=Caminibacter mediatlanticus TB-2 TaxID=391592 RepID=A0AAI9AHZ3_9BACT|nr:lipopolysaccharide transport periplasmic protein LptA [Caminibacter mediatlanticus]EDM23865.1 OstA family protein [Caminibacter mediatlanticus TB-2]